MSEPKPYTQGQIYQSSDLGLLGQGPAINEGYEDSCLLMFLGYIPYISLGAGGRNGWLGNTPVFLGIWP